MSSPDFKSKWPLHWHVWYNEYEVLESLLGENQYDIEKLDVRGRTPLHLATALGHIESARVLLHHDGNANAENHNYWTVVQEAVCTGDPMLLQLCLQHRDQQRHSHRTEGVPGLLHKLTEAPDFYVEMKWEFASWVPLVSRMCPSDTYRVWKSGSNVRIDTTLLGFDNTSWQRGNRSFIFKGGVDTATVIEIDHDAHQIYSELMRVVPENAHTFVMPSENAVAARLTAPVVTTYIDTEKIAFERSKSGLWGWRSDKTEVINGHNCKVFSASNVELVTKTRTEHLTDFDKQQSKKTNKSPLESILGLAEKEEKARGPISNREVSATSNNPCNLTPEEYFDASVDLRGRDIGRPIEQTKKTQKFKAQLWLAENYPLSLPEQVIPIIDLMAANNAHFKKLKDFITLQLPAGFPVKIEIPLFHVLNARITFGNIFGLDSAAQFVTTINNDNGRLSCVVDQDCFDCPPGYSVMGDLRQERLRDEDDELLQFAIQQSLIEAGSENDQVTLWEALDKTRPVANQGNQLHSEEGRMFQKAIEESLRLSGNCGEVAQHCTTQVPNELRPPPNGQSSNDDMHMALEISRREQQEARQLQQQEEAQLQRILELSLTDK